MSNLNETNNLNETETNEINETNYADNTEHVTNNNDGDNGTENKYGVKYNIRISSKHEGNLVTRYDEKLTAAGFIYNKKVVNHRVTLNSFYELDNASESVANEWKTWAEYYRLKCHIVEMKFARSEDYRRLFLKNNDGIYRCVYCGRKVPKKKMQVDHLFSVSKMMYLQTTRDMAKRYGIEETNSLNNLVASCERCNRRKSDKMGVWILKGRLGKHEIYWKLRIAFCIVIGLFILYYLYMNGYIVLPEPKPFSILDIFKNYLRNRAINRAFR